jgi:hypothetical protein
LVCTPIKTGSTASATRVGGGPALAWSIAIGFEDPIAGWPLGAARDGVMHRAAKKHAGVIRAVVDEN